MSQGAGAVTDNWDKDNCDKKWIEKQRGGQGDICCRLRF